MRREKRNLTEPALHHTTLENIAFLMTETRCRRTGGQRTHALPIPISLITRTHLARLEARSASAKAGRCAIASRRAKRIRPFGDCVSVNAAAILRGGCSFASSLPIGPAGKMTLEASPLLSRHILLSRPGLTISPKQHTSEADEDRGHGKAENERIE